MTRRELEDERKTLINYIQTKLTQEDWRIVAEIVIDLIVIEAKLDLIDEFNSGK